MDVLYDFSSHSKSFEHLFQIIIDIQNEILSMFPLVDIDLSDKINSVLLPLLKQLAKNNGNIISSEL